MRYPVNRTSGSVFRHPLFRPSDSLRMGSWMPALDLNETEDAFQVAIELPGVEPADIEVSYDSGTLTLRGEKKSRHDEQAEGYRRVERRYGSFERSVRVGSAVDAERIGAECRDGVLIVTLPKAEESKPRRIELAGSEVIEAQS